MEPMGGAGLGICTFFASAHPNESCGMNGLPLTPNSIQILGEFQYLKTLKHPNICQYVDICRGKHERLMVVSERYGHCVADALAAGSPLDTVRLAWELLQALHHLHQHQVVVRNLSTSTVRLAADGAVKLSQYGLYYMTRDGELVAFPIGDVAYLAPEVLASGLTTEFRSGAKSDVWSAGMVLSRAALAGRHWPRRDVAQEVMRVFRLMNSSDVLTELADDAQARTQLKSLPEDLVDLLRQCLTPDPAARPSVSDLLSHRVFSGRSPPPASRLLQPFPLMFDSPVGEDEAADSGSEGAGVEAHLRTRPLTEVYHLWRLAGGDLEAELRNQGRVKGKPPILTVPNVVTLEGETFGVRRDRDTLYDPSEIALPLEPLLRRLSDVTAAAFYPLLEKRMGPVLHSQSQMELQETAQLPLVIRESDIEYQLHRITLFSRLTQVYPFLSGRLEEEARTDTPPLYRAHGWAALLRVTGLLQSRYDAIDKLTAIPTDRQIEVDIPRCHQYDELLSSPAGHRKLQRVLKAWVVTHPQYVYWQGLDSLAAPLVYLNFNNEALAYASLSAFITKYLHDFFLKDNAAVIQEYLAVFGLLTAFVDPLLGQHLTQTGFVPELYAIPWFLTMFTHVFPLHKIFHLWDALLLEDSGFPLCVGVAILQQLRDRLLQFGFNECILLFSDMPDINMEAVVVESLRVQALTPRSVLHREHAPPSEHSRPGRLEGPPLPLAELRQLRLPRLAAAELIEWSRRPGPSQVCVLDVRPADDFQRGCFPGAVHAPPGSLLTEDGQLVPGPAANAVRAAKGQVMCVVGGRNAAAVKQTSEGLLALGFPRVCTLHRGVEALREAQALQVPSS
ncbi:TBC domain-containing protein kinase-like protein [Amphibalanus amphitrite]|uniref:TBC domain-containing protein kinase-like protein n=1 Tax=Amphibalanus amphitrite TaxID=1232801 RepID=UPI001C91727E|nr:TBC domain-containing protein kinase-like protein [Amphibalanus amphitrite]XP_043192086.1 TBC domain-containing protein kinase-like protein [Amphibalanus amphitrite]